MRVNPTESQFKLFDHQKKCIEYFVSQNSGMLQMDPGCGKTITALEILALRNKKRILIICPKNTLVQWKREAANYGHDAVIIKDKKKIPKGEVFVATHLSVLNAAMVKFINKTLWDAIIIDESQRYKNPKAKSTKAILKLVKNFTVVWLLTGTPVTRDLLDLFTQMFCINPEIFGPKYTRFRSKYFYNATDGGPFPKWVPQFGAQERILARIKPFVFTAKKEDCLSLPPLTRITREVELEPKHMAQYKIFDAEFMLALDGDREMVSKNTAAKLTRLMQFACGIVTDTEGNSTFVGSEKINALAELLEEILPTGEKIIIWNHWRNLIKPVRAMLPKDHIYVDVDEPIYERQESIDAFIRSPGSRVLLASQGSIGRGTDGLQVASYAIYLSKTYDLEIDIQSEARFNRSGSERHSKLTRYDIIADKTVDEKVTRGLWNKMKIVEALRNN